MFGTPEPPVAAGDLSAWLLELGTAARENELRMQHRKSRGRYLSAWSSRRAASRARRLIVRQALQATASEAVFEPAGADEASVVVPPAWPGESVGTPLLDRIADYTLSGS